MATTKMTIHRALSELKLIDSRITKQIGEIEPVAFHQKDKRIGGHLTTEEFKKNAESKYSSVTDLISRKTAIKTAIVKSNTNAVVTVGGKQMSVADAITKKDSIKLNKTLIATLKSKHLTNVAGLNRNNEIVNTNVQKVLESALGKDNVKPDNTQVDAIRKPYLEANEFHLFDPIEVTKKIEVLEKEVGEFESEVDAVLSESNATTFIEV